MTESRTERVEGMLPKYIEIKFGYSCNLVLPYDQGVKTLDLINAAEERIYKHSEYVIREFDAKDVEIRLISQADYTEAKTKALLLDSNNTDE